MANLERFNLLRTSDPDLHKVQENVRRVLDQLRERILNGAQGSASVTPDSNGNAKIAHGLASAPSFALAGIRGDNAYAVDVESLDATYLTLRVSNRTTNADVTSGTYTVDWIAKR